MRDALGTGTVEEARFDYQGKQVAGWKMTMTPFASDPNKDKLAELVGRRYVFLFSDEVPGGLYEIRVVTPKLDGSANIIETSLTLSGATDAGREIGSNANAYSSWGRALASPSAPAPRSRRT